MLTPAEMQTKCNELNVSKQNKSVSLHLYGKL